MNIKDFLDNLAKELQSKAGITVEIVDDHNFPGGFYMNFSEFSTAVLRVNQYGKFSMRGVNFENDVFSYPWKYKYLILTDNAVNALAKTFPQVEFDSTKEAEKAMFPLFCYINVLHQFYRKKLGSKKRWYDKRKSCKSWCNPGSKCLWSELCKSTESGSRYGECSYWGKSGSC
jgi:hypothetical protein